MVDVNPDYVQKFLAGLDWPASKEEIVEVAEREGAGEPIVSALRQLPDQSYGSAEEIASAVSGVEGELVGAEPEFVDDDAKSPAPGRAIGGGTARGAGASGSRG